MLPKEFIQTVLRDKAVSNRISAIMESVSGTFVDKLSTITLIVGSNPKLSLTESIDFIESNFMKVYSILREHAIQLPEEAQLIKEVVQLVAEEGEGVAPANVTAGIEPSTPRIRTTQSKEIEDGIDRN